VSAAAATSFEGSPALGHWQREVERLTSNPAELSDAAREMLATVLRALAVEPTSDRQTRRDIRRVLEAIAPEARALPRLAGTAGAAVGRSGPMRASVL
jgi:MoxR-like ATPase